MISQAQERYVGLALIGHWSNSRNTEVHLETGDGGCCSIWGNGVRALVANKPVVVLSSEGSASPLAAVVHPDAWFSFEEAALRLARDGVEFCTVMHAGGATTTMLWTQSYL